MPQSALDDDDDVVIVRTVSSRVTRSGLVFDSAPLVQSTLDKALKIRNPRLTSTGRIRKGNPNVFVPGQENTLLSIPPELLLMVIREHFCALNINIRKPKDLERARKTRQNPAAGQSYLNLALVNITFYRLCLPLLFDHAIFRYTTTFSDADLNRIAYQLNVSLRVKVIESNTALARNIANMRETNDSLMKPFPRLETFIVKEKFSGRHRYEFSIAAIPGIGKQFEKQGVSFEVYITINGRTPGVVGYRSKMQRLKVCYLKNAEFKLYEAEYVLPSSFEKWSHWIEEECKQKLCKPESSLETGLICYKDKSMHWET